MAIYEVEFRYNGAEYEYDIRSSDGSILKSERDDDNDYSYAAVPSASGSLVGEAAAQSAALSVDDQYLHASPSQGILLSRILARLSISYA